MFLSGAIVLAIMILPTIINISEDALRAVPRAYKEGALALGSTHFQTIFKVILPAAKSGIISAVVLAMGRALGGNNGPDYGYRQCNHATSTWPVEYFRSC